MTTQEEIKLEELQNLLNAERGLTVKLEKTLEKLREGSNSFIYEALINAQMDFPIIFKNTKSFSNQYFASMVDLVKGTRPILKKYGLAVQFTVQYDKEKDIDILHTTLLHKTGQKISSSNKILYHRPANVKDSLDLVKEQCKARTFLKRYAYADILGLVTEEVE